MVIFRKFTSLVFIILFATLVIKTNVFAQGFDSQRKELASFLTRMYNNEPFEGVRVITDYDNAYLLSVLSIDKTKYTNESTLNRVASIKAMSEASRYFNGSNITSEIIIHTSENSDGSGDTWILENIKEHSVGYVKQLQQLTNFTASSGRQVFIFCKQLENSME